MGLNARSAADPVRLAILGSTGSIGTQTLDVVAQHPERFSVVALAAGQNIELLQQQTRTFHPELVVLDAYTPDVAAFATHVEFGDSGLLAAATLASADIVVVATSGHAAIRPTFEAIKAGKIVALANKETIVCAGELIVPYARSRGAEIRPVDSEHSAIWQAIGRAQRSEISRLIVTASGGPFRDTAAEGLANVTVKEALTHPTWHMGDKITIDSATLMNKGLEVIEAHWLFDIPFDEIDVVIHPESIVHSLVEFVDGSQMAQLGLPDMRIPIQFALTYPHHVAGASRRLSLADVGVLHFSKPDETRFPALKLARVAAAAGRTYPTVISAADEVAIAAFLDGRLSFTGITDIVAGALDSHQPDGELSFESIAAADAWTRTFARGEIERKGR